MRIFLWHNSPVNNKPPHIPRKRQRVLGCNRNQFRQINMFTTELPACSTHQRNPRNPRNPPKTYSEKPKRFWTCFTTRQTPDTRHQTPDTRHQTPHTRHRPRRAATASLHGHGVRIFRQLPGAQQRHTAADRAEARRLKEELHLT